MADGIDAKGIGLAAKDIVIGIAAAAVGAAGGGQAGASGVLKAGDGIDKIIAMTTGGDSRAQRFDRADYTAKPQPQQPLAPAPPNPSIQQIPTDREQAVFHLASVGWNQEQTNKILAGPQKYRMAQIAPPQVAGQRVELAEGNAVELEKGAPVALTSGEAIKPKAATAVPLVEGRRVPKNETA